MSDSEKLDKIEAIVEDNSLEMSELKQKVNALLERAKNNHIKVEASQGNFEIIAAEIKEIAAENSRILDRWEGKQQDDG